MKISKLFKNDLKHNWLVFLIAAVVLILITGWTTILSFGNWYQNDPQQTITLNGVTNLLFWAFYLALYSYVLINNWRRDAREYDIELLKLQKSYHWYRIGYVTLVMIFFMFVAQTPMMIINDISAQYFLHNLLNPYELIFYLPNFLLLMGFFYVAKYKYLYNFKVATSQIMLLTILVLNSISTLLIGPLFFTVGLFFGTVISIIVFTIMNAHEFGNSPTNEQESTKKSSSWAIVVVIIAMLVPLTIWYAWVTFVPGATQSPPESTTMEDSEYGTKTVTYDSKLGMTIDIQGDYNLTAQTIADEYNIKVTDPNSDQQVIINTEEKGYEQDVVYYKIKVIDDATTDPITYKECEDTQAVDPDYGIFAQISIMLEESCLSNTQADEIMQLIDYAFR